MPAPTAMVDTTGVNIPVSGGSIHARNIRHWELIAPTQLMQINTEADGL